MSWTITAISLFSGRIVDGLNTLSRTPEFVVEIWFSKTDINADKLHNDNKTISKGGLHGNNTWKCK